MSDKLTINRKFLSEGASNIMDRMIRIHPGLQDGDRNLTNTEALRYIDFLEDGMVDGCDVQIFNETLPFAEAISSGEFSKAFEAIAKLSPPIRKLKTGLWNIEDCLARRATIAQQNKIFSHNGFQIISQGFSVKIDESLLKVMAETGKEMNRFLFTPSNPLQIHWAQGLNQPAGDPTLNEFFSGVFDFGKRATSVAVWYKLAHQLAKDLEQRSINHSLGRTPGNKVSYDFWEGFCQLHLKARENRVLMELLDIPRYLPEVPKEWGIIYQFELGGSYSVDNRDVFASVAVIVRYFRKEFEKKVRGLPEGEMKKLASEIGDHVGQRFGISP